MSLRIGKTKIDKTLIYLIFGILVFGLVVTNINSASLQAQYTIFNEITAQTYIYSDDNNLNVYANEADKQIKVKVVLDYIEGVTEVGMSVYDEDMFMGVSTTLSLISDTAYESDWVDVSGLPNGNYDAVCNVMAGAVEVNQPDAYNLVIKHPAQAMGYIFSVQQDGLLMGEEDIVSGEIGFKLEITTGVATGAWMNLYKGTEMVNYQDKLDSITDVDNINAYIFDSALYEDGDYWVKLGVLGSAQWSGFTTSLSIKIENVVAAIPITSDVKVFTKENSNWILVGASGVLHDTIRVTATLLTGEVTGYVMSVYVAGSNTAVHSMNLVIDASGVYVGEFDTRSLANGDYTFNVDAINIDNILVPQSAWSTGVWTPTDPAEPSNLLMWVGIAIAISIITIVFIKRGKLQIR